MTAKRERPSTVINRINAEYVDEVAVERAMSGDRPVYMTAPERLEVIRRLAAKALPDSVIAARLHVTTNNVQHLRQKNGIPTRFVRPRTRWVEVAA